MRCRPASYAAHPASSVSSASRRYSARPTRSVYEARVSSRATNCTSGSTRSIRSAPPSASSRRRSAPTSAASASGTSAPTRPPPAARSGAGSASSQSCAMAVGCAPRRAGGGPAASSPTVAAGSPVRGSTVRDRRAMAISAPPACRAASSFAATVGVTWRLPCSMSHRWPCEHGTALARTRSDSLRLVRQRCSACPNVSCTATTKSGRMRTPHHFLSLSVLMRLLVLG